MFYVPEVIRALECVLKAGFTEDFELDKTTFDLLKESDDLFFTFKKGSNIKEKNVQFFSFYFFLSFLLLLFEEGWGR